MPETNMTRLLERSLERNRLAHAYLFSGDSLDELEIMARTLAGALNCASARAAAQPPLHSCGQCDSCRRIQHDVHPDVLWVRPESKSRVILIDQIRDLMRTVNLKPTVAKFKVGVIVAADRLNPQAGNAFLKTLEEPPADSILVLLTTQPQRILETVLSRCLRLSFGGESAQTHAQHAAWLAAFAGAGRRAPRRVSISRPCADQPGARPVLVRRNGWPEAADRTRIRFRLHHCPAACPFSRSRRLLATRRPNTPRVQLSCHPPAWRLPAPTADARPAGCARLPLVQRVYWFAFGYRPGPWTVARQTLR